MQVPNNVVALWWSSPAVLKAIAPPRALQGEAAADFTIAQRKLPAVPFCG